MLHRSGGSERLCRPTGDVEGSHAIRCRGCDKTASVTDTVHRVLRCCDTRHSKAFEREQRHRQVFGSPRGGYGIVGKEVPLACARRVVWGILYVDDAGIVSVPAKGLRNITTAVVTVFEAAGLTV